MKTPVWPCEYARGFKVVKCKAGKGVWEFTLEPIAKPKGKKDASK